jgi:hypothetical protein
MKIVRLFPALIGAAILSFSFGCAQAAQSGLSVPTFSPAGGAYTAAQTVTLSSDAAGAAIRYTTDGTAPTSSTGTLYAGSINVAETEIIQAIAYQAGGDESPVATATYSIPFPGVAGAVNLLANGDFLALTAGGADPSTLPIWPAAGAENSWLNWSASILRTGGQWASMFTNSGDLGHTSSTDTSKVVIYGDGGNYTAFLKQSLTSVPAGNYTASAWILVGNWTYRATVSVIDDTSSTVIASKTYSFGQTKLSSSQVANSKNWLAIGCPVSIAATGPVTYQISLTCDPVPGWSSTDHAHNTFIRVDDCAFTAAVLTAN